MEVSRPLCLMGLLVVTMLSGQAWGQQQCSIDLALIVDSSGSIRDNNVVGQTDNWELVLNFLQQLVQGLNVGAQQTRVGMVIFGNSGRVEFQLDTYETLNQVQGAIRATPYAGGNTNTSGGLLVARNDIFNQANGERADYPNVAIVMTDGKSTYDADKTLQSAASLRNEARVFVIGVTNQVNEDEIQGIATASNGGTPVLDTDYFLSTSFSNLDEIRAEVTASTCQAVVSTPTPIGKCALLCIMRVFLWWCDGTEPHCFHHFQGQHLRQPPPRQPLPLPLPRPLPQ